jgi:hypothetical protein
LNQKNKCIRNKPVLNIPEKKLIRIMFVDPLSTGSNFSRKLPKFIDNKFNEELPDADE